jgi:hypothetical protein
MEQRTSRENDSSSNGQEIPDNFYEHQRSISIHKSPLIVRILDQMNPGKAIHSHFF